MQCVADAAIRRIRPFGDAMRTAIRSAMPVSFSASCMVPIDQSRYTTLSSRSGTELEPRTYRRRRPRDLWHVGVAMQQLSQPLRL